MRLSLRTSAVPTADDEAAGPFAAMASGGQIAGPRAGRQQAGRRQLLQPDLPGRWQFQHTLKAPGRKGARNTLKGAERKEVRSWRGCFAGSWTRGQLRYQLEVGKCNQEAYPTLGVWGAIVFPRGLVLSASVVGRCLRLTLPWAVMRRSRTHLAALLAQTLQRLRGRLNKLFGTKNPVCVPRKPHLQSCL